MIKLLLLPLLSIPIEAIVMDNDVIITTGTIANDANAIVTATAGNDEATAAFSVKVLILILIVTTNYNTSVITETWKQLHKLLMKLTPISQPPTTLINQPPITLTKPLLLKPHNCNNSQCNRCHSSSHGLNHNTSPSFFCSIHCQQKLLLFLMYTLYMSTCCCWSCSVSFVGLLFKAVIAPDEVSSVGCRDLWKMFELPVGTNTWSKVNFVSHHKQLLPHWF